MAVRASTAAAMASSVAAQAPVIPGAAADREVLKATTAALPVPGLFCRWRRGWCVVLLI